MKGGRNMAINMLKNTTTSEKEKRSIEHEDLAARRLLEDVPATVAVASDSH
jgi:hypothetical protein